MRLLQYSGTSEFSFTEYYDQIPPYAILSHLWGLDTDEATFEDLMNGTGKDKIGYKKIRFCGEQARQDGLQYFWIDTCCINKASYAELSEAINLMFRWYENAATCYVYLSDVSTTKRKASDWSSEFTWESAFQESRWFKRGWTLQELLAPVRVEFFSQEWQRLGDKRSLKQQIHEITGIADLALQGAPLSQFSIDERLSWIECRQTKLEEDKAYSLLGIFGVHMGLIYGEGSENAFRRLAKEVKGMTAPLVSSHSLLKAPQNIRLLERSSAGEFNLTKNFVGGNIPPYAILSHTWGANDEEVTFEDLRDGTGKDKAGYDKIRFCREQANRDGLQFFWIDTCCIDNANDTEVQEAINSMFHYYQAAARCYVYLSDVSQPALYTNDNSSQLPWESSFRNSRWFTRGWTLQELLAPASVEFFSKEGEELGSKISLERQIREITGIPVTALQGSPLSTFSITERISWAENRVTRRTEDKAYSLLGIFDIYMPIIYGEGRERAFKRLTREIEERTGSLAISRAPSQVPRNFRPLRGSGFRIFVLDPGEKGSKITGYIQEWDLREPPEYNALSYVWGDEPAIHPVDINNEESFMRPNLFHALQRIRGSRRPVSLWVDSICINQFDESERNIQVTRMADIFYNAKSVWVWLGEEDSASKIAMEFIPQMIHDDFQWDGVWWEKPDFISFDRILARAWFRRRWVIQEAAVSTNSVILCGDRKVNMNHFTRAVSMVRTKLGTISRSFSTAGKNMLHKGFLANFRDSPATRLLDIIKDVFDRSNEAIPSRRLSLETLVDLSTFCETTDQRDTIFALLNLANDIDSPSEPGLTDLIVPDYNSSLLDVFADFVLQCSRRSGSLDIICRPWAPVPSSAMRTIGQVDLVDPALQSIVPSWIASRDGLPFGTKPWDMTSRLHGKSLVGNSRKQIYNAHYCTKPQVRLGRNEATNTCSGSLYTKGIILGTITQRSTRMADAIITNDSLEILRMNSPDQQLNPANLPDTIWRTLCADRDTRGESAPLRYCSSMIQLLQLISDIPKIGHRSNQVNIMPSIDIEEFLETDLPEEVKEFLEVVRDVVWNRRTFQGKRMDDNGSPIVGLIPRYAQVGDRLCILYGCSVPVVLRNHSWGGDHCWQLIGEAFVYGFMGGEGISSMSPAMLKSAEVEFEIR
jgi:hypothetical protein